jgi:GAF domain-containing protein
MTPDAMDRLVTALNDTADRFTTSPSGRDLAHTIRLIVAGAVAVIPGATHAGITVRRPDGSITTTTPTGEVVARLDQAQAVLREGPCVDAVNTAQPRSDRTDGHPEAGVMVLVEDMTTESHVGRWPRFAPEALRNGIVSMISLRLAGDRRDASALNLYADRPEVFDEEARTIAQAFADQAAIALYGAHQTAALNEALANRDVIGQAKGILIERHGLSTDTEAFAMLVEASQHANIKLHDVARWLVKDTTDKQAAKPLDEG